MNLEAFLKEISDEELQKLDIKNIISKELDRRKSVRVNSLIIELDKVFKSFKVNVSTKNLTQFVNECIGVKKTAPKAQVNTTPHSVNSSLKVTSPPGKIKYMHKNDKSKVWSGKGAKPKWLLEELSNGLNIEEFDINNPSHPFYQKI